MNKVKVLRQSSKFQWFNSTVEKLDDQTRQVISEMIGNKTIVGEMEKIIEKNFPKSRANQSNNIENESRFVNTSEVDESASIEEQQKIEEKLQLAIEEEGEKAIVITQDHLTSILEEPRNGLMYSVFSDLNKGPNVSNVSSLQSVSLLSLLNRKNNSNFSNRNNIRRKKNSSINENANFGSLPSCKTSSDTSNPSAWATVNDWLSKAFKKIQKYTTDFLSLLSKVCKSLLIEFGILILGIALLYSAGIIPNPSFFFKMFYNSLLSLISGFF